MPSMASQLGFAFQQPALAALLHLQLCSPVQGMPSMVGPFGSAGAQSVSAATPSRSPGWPSHLSFPLEAAPPGPYLCSLSPIRHEP